MARIVAAEREMGRDGNPRSILALFYDLGESLGDAMGQNVLIGATAARLSECQIVIRNALIGGNDGKVDGEAKAVPETEARELVDTYCYPARPAMHDLALAWQILRAAIYGVEVSGSKKKDGETVGPAPS